jgi:hypothetical protein
MRQLSEQLAINRGSTEGTTWKNRAKATLGINRTTLGHKDKSMQSCTGPAAPWCDSHHKLQDHFLLMCWLDAAWCWTQKKETHV